MSTENKFFIQIKSDILNVFTRICIRIYFLSTMVVTSTTKISVVQRYVNNIKDERKNIRRKITIYQIKRIVKQHSTLLYIKGHCTWLLHIVHGYCTKHMVITHCTWLLHIAHGYCTLHCYTVTLHITHSNVIAHCTWLLQICTQSLHICT